MKNAHGTALAQGVNVVNCAQSSHANHQCCNVIARTDKAGVACMRTRCQHRPVLLSRATVSLATPSDMRSDVPFAWCCFLHPCGTSVEPAVHAVFDHPYRDHSSCSEASTLDNAEHMCCDWNVKHSRSHLSGSIQIKKNRTRLILDCAPPME